MKNFLAAITIFSGVFLGSQVCAQEYLEPEWKFHFAFEDATGARDTVWIYLDSQINSWYPYEQGAFGVFPFSVPADEFSVYTGYSQTEYGKVAVGNIEWPMDLMIFASNYSYPITLSWDSALFLSPVLAETQAGYIYQPRLDNDYFFNYHDEVGMYHMIYESQVEMPWFWWGSQDHFPLFVYFDRGFWSWGPPGTRNVKGVQDLRIYPNPAVDVVHIDRGPNATPLRSVDVFALDGRNLLSTGATGAGGDGIYEVNVSGLLPGMYVLHTVAADGRRGSARFVKVE